MTLNLTNCPSEPAPYISATPRTLSRHKDDSVQLPLNLPLPHTFMRTFFFHFTSKSIRSYLTLKSKLLLLTWKVPGCCGKPSATAETLSPGRASQPRGTKPPFVKHCPASLFSSLHCSPEVRLMPPPCLLPSLRMTTDPMRQRDRRDL